MKISIRKSKHQLAPMTDNQFAFAFQSVVAYKKSGYKTYYLYDGSVDNEKMKCDIYMTKTQISAIVYHG